MYLRKIEEYRNEGRPIVYLDETWIHPHYTVKKCWQSDEVSGVRTYDSPGERLIIVHAGGSMGFIPGAALIFKANSKTGDYHSQMNASNFEKWLKEKLAVNLPFNSVVVMDNAPYHSVQTNRPPTMTSKKEDLIKWLEKNVKNSSFDSKMTKEELMMVIRRNKPEPIYSCDVILQNLGFSVLRLAPYHCDLSPIEYVWSLVKKRVACKNMDTNIKKL